jgi:hypothetical protein
MIFGKKKKKGVADTEVKKKVKSQAERMKELGADIDKIQKKK